MIFAAYAVGVITALVAFGRLSDEVGRRRTLLGALALSALSAAVFLITQGPGLLLVGRVLSGLSAGIFTGTATAAIVDFAEPGEEGSACHRGGTRLPRADCRRAQPRPRLVGVGALAQAASLRTAGLVFAAAVACRNPQRWVPTS